MPDKVAQKHVGKQHADDASRKQKTSASDEILAQLARDLTRSGVSVPYSTVKIGC